MTTTFTLIVDGRDTWGERTLNAIEAAVRGPIVGQVDDGRGGMRFYVRPRIRPTKPQRKEIVEAVRAIIGVAGTSRWMEN